MFGMKGNLMRFDSDVLNNVELFKNNTTTPLTEQVITEMIKQNCSDEVIDYVKRKMFVEKDLKFAEQLIEHLSFMQVGRIFFDKVESEMNKQ